MKRGEQGPLYRAVDEGGGPAQPQPAPTGALAHRAVRFDPPERPVKRRRPCRVNSRPTRLHAVCLRARFVRSPVDPMGLEPTGSDAAGVLRDYEHDGPSTATDEVALLAPVAPR